jgi:glycerate kinase
VLAPPLRALVAPDAFKGTMAAGEVAAALGRGIEAAGGVAEPLALADGGEGTADALLGALGGELVPASAHDPLGRPLRAAFGWVAARRLAIVETAAASGLHLVAERERDAERASTAGTGELIAAAAAHGATTIAVAVGGSATTDGGAGALEAIAAAGGLRGPRLVALCDVRTPFERAAEVYGPQKGADPDAVARLTARLRAQAAALPHDPRGVPMTGAAGGLSGALWAAHGAELVAGAEWVLDAVGFDERLARADLALTGEGRVDEQTPEGKLVSAVAARCAAAGVPLHVVCGANGLGPGAAARLGVASVREAGDPAALERAGAAIAREAAAA